MSSHSEELKILSVYGKGEGPLATDGHDTLFTASEVEALNSLSADHSVAKSLERGEQLVCREELSVQQTPDTISIKVEEDIGGGFPAVEDCIDIRDCSTQRGATSESLRVDAPGSSHMSSHSGELRILSVYGQGEGPLAVDGHDTLFTASEVEAMNSLPANHSAAKSLERGERLVCREELSVQQQTPDTISIKVEEDIGAGMPAVVDAALSGDCPAPSADAPAVPSSLSKWIVPKVQRLLLYNHWWLIMPQDPATGSLGEGRVETLLSSSSPSAGDSRSPC
ncbi:unnamed protein product [Boreogadus saida]